MCESIRLYLRNGRWTEPAPRYCPNGHRLGPGQVLVGAVPCLRSGGHHRTHALHTPERADEIRTVNGADDKRAYGAAMRDRIVEE
ncbi:hypothetical protein [Nocardia fluminea]|uniref:hypothetical protein n=1 Tax=Nocardia fluminea TaxID=134984 RepID=UPI003647F9BD